MPSALLVETVTMLQQRVEIRRQYLQRNESPTRQLLIDPLLDALGWDFKDSSRVILEYPVGKLRIDYVLLVDGRPKVAVEAKRVGTRLSGEPARQALRYANKASIRYAVVTDGVRWLMHDAFADGESISQPLMELDLTTMNAPELVRLAERMSYTRIAGERWTKTEHSD